MSQHYSRVALVAALLSSGLATAQPPLNPELDPTLPTDEAEPAPKVVGFWYGHVESDNIARTVTPEDGSYDGLGLVVDLGHRSRRLVADVDTHLEYRDYSPDTLDSEVVGTLNGTADVQLIQDRFSWTFADYYGQGITDPRSGIGPGNREQINALATGPHLDLDFGARTSMELGATAEQVRFSESNYVDTDSVRTELGLYRQASSTARYGIVVSSNQVEYVDVLAPEYDIDRLAVRYEKRLATGRVLADLGTNEITTGGLENDGPLYNFVWTRSLTARSSLSVRAGRALSDAGGVLISNLGPDLEGRSFSDVLVTPRPLEQSRLGASYLLTLSRTRVSAELDSYEDEYVGNSFLDNDWTTLRVAFTRIVTPRLSIGIGHDKIERDFVDNAQADGADSWTVAWLNRTFGSRMFFGFAISNYDRSGLESYDEQRYEIRFGYSPTESGTEAMALVGR